ncbi:hypothetical protein BDD12DRAFT_910439 [Trichophaea hybrida]|nr:hypothetical protein BDD12DRAFT_910439 [Trichophaea hybrida]
MPTRRKPDGPIVAKTKGTTGVLVIVATDQLGRVLEFKVLGRTVFVKLATRWCAHQRVPITHASFFSRGKRLAWDLSIDELSLELEDVDGRPTASVDVVVK